MNQPRIHYLEKLKSNVDSIYRDLNWNEPGYEPNIQENLQKLVEVVEELINGLLRNEI